MDPAPRRTDNFARQLGRAYERRAATAGRDFFRRTTHIDVQTVKAELADDMSDLVKELWCLAVNLRDHGALYFRIEEIFDQRVRRMKCRLDIDELGQRHVGRAMDLVRPSSTICPAAVSEG